MPDVSLTTLDLGLIAAYFALVLFIGIRVGRGHRDAEDYFLAGRRMAWPLVGISLFASNISSTTLIGLSGDAYATGISVFNYEWMASVILVFFAIFLIPVYLQSRVYTMPEFLERRFDARSRYYFSGLTLVGNILIDTAGALYAGGLLLKLIVPEVELWLIILVLSLCAGAYTVLGGLKAVIYTDAIQTTLILTGALAVTWLAWREAGGLAPAAAVTPPEMLSLLRPMDDPAMPWTGLLFGVPVLGFYFWCTNQFMVQRVLSARDEQNGRYGLLLAAALKLPVLFIMVYPGTLARVLYPDLDNPDLVYPTLLFDLLPAGLTGLVVAGVLAALMSSIDSTLNSASTLVTMDFVRKARPALNSHQLMIVGRVTAFCFMLLAAAWAPFIERFDSLFRYLQSVLAFIAPPVVVVFLLGVLWRGMTARAAFTSLMAGLALAVAMLTGQLLGVVTLHFLHIAGLLFAACLALAVVVSVAAPAPPSAAQIRVTWSRRRFRAEVAAQGRLPWYRNYLVLSALLLAVTAVLVFIHR